MELVTWFWEGLRAHVQKYPGFVILFICFSILAILSEIFLAILSIFALFLFHYYHHQPHFLFYGAVFVLVLCLAGHLHFFYCLQRERIFQAILSVKLFKRT